MNAIRVALAEQLGQDRYDLWFGPQVTLAYHDGQLRIGSAEAFRLECIRRTYSSDLQAACRQTLDASSQLYFEVLAAAEEPETDEPEDRAKDEPVSSVVQLANSPAIVSTKSNSGAKSPSPKSQCSSASQPNATSDSTPAHVSTVRIANETPRRKWARLETFVNGPCNGVASMAAGTIFSGPAHANPLFLHGPPGVGKTHLLEGIYSAARRGGRIKRAVFLSAEQFTNYYLAALKGTGLPSFRHRYRDVDLLLIDDVQFFVGKRSTMAELQHTIDTLLRDGRRIVLSADRSPHELNGLGTELVHRMSGGLVCRIDAPRYETRLGVLRRFVGERGYSTPDCVLEMLARELPGDGRLLSGALNRLHAFSLANRTPITLELAEQALDDLFRAAKPVVKLTDIDQAVCDVFGLEPSTLQSDCRSKWISHPRMLAMWLARKYTRAAHVEIGEYFGRRSHSTVISAQQKVEQWIASDSPIRGARGDWRIEEAVRRIEEKLRTG
ncbi:MAG: ATP-binding protein [Planctomycetales bacterium]|nr:ATP-binding protein [Planctomycetales bacterium]